MKTQLLILLALTITCFAELVPNQHYTGEMKTDGSVKAEAEVILKGLSPKDKFLANILWTPGAELQLTATITKTINGGVRFVYRDHFGNKGTGTLTKTDGEVTFTFEAREVVEPRGARLGGDYFLKPYNPETPKK